MSEEMIEKVAQALHEAACKDYRVRGDGDLSSWPEDYREHQRVLARAALSAYNPNERLTALAEKARAYNIEHLPPYDCPLRDILVEAAALSPLPQGEDRG